MMPRRAFCFWKAAFLHAVSLTKPCYHCKFIIFPELGEERALAWIKNVKRCRFHGFFTIFGHAAGMDFTKNVKTTAKFCHVQARTANLACFLLKTLQKLFKRSITSNN